MSIRATNPSTQLSAETEKLLSILVQAAQACFKEDLRSVVLFGSGAEGKLRPTSDLNLLFILKRFEKDRADAFREPLRVAYVAGRASAMFVLESELPAAAEAFAVKFDDIARRYTVLYGEDLVRSLAISRVEKVRRLRQVLMNQVLRFRQSYLIKSLREEQLALVIAEAAGPLRAAAATLLELEGTPVPSPSDALKKLATGEGSDALAQALGRMSEARESRALPAGVAGPVLLSLLRLTEIIRQRAEALK